MLQVLEKKFFLVYNKEKRKGDSMTKVGIIVAMDEEFDAIKQKMPKRETKQIYNLRFKLGNIGNKECVMVKSGIGKVNAARTTQVMSDHFDLEYIINIGTVGGINDSLKIGDVVIGKHVVQHDFDITAFGHSKGYITGIGDRIKCNTKLVDQLTEMIKDGPERKYATKVGVVATGDIFCEETFMKDKIRAKFDADVVDMECGAIAQVAYLNNIPFMTVKCISDVPNGQNAYTHEQTLKLTSKICANLLEEFLQKS